MKKTTEDKKTISGVKQKAAAPKKAAPKTLQGELPMTEIEDMPAFQVGGGVPVGMGPMSDIDRKMAESERRRKMARTQNAQGAGLNPGQMSQFAGQEMGGMGQAAPTPGGQGQAAPMGTQDTQSIMEGLRQLGKFACGGSI
jgi:hypothetical protein